ncbi:MAG: hypothetical protein IKF79_01445 [Methanosphaera sp.]|nr:hypothetical protein [Methanosphaera sp.]
MLINDLLKAYGVKFSIDFNGVNNEINPEFLSVAEIIVNNDNEFKLHVKEDDGELFELIVKTPNTVIYNYYTPEGELYMTHSYSDEGIEIGN